MKKKKNLEKKKTVSWFYRGEYAITMREYLDFQKKKQKKQSSQPIAVAVRLLHRDLCFVVKRGG